MELLLPREEGMAGVEREKGFMGRSGHAWVPHLSWEYVTQTGRTMWRPEKEPQVDAKHPWMWAPCPRSTALHYQCGSWMVKVSLVCALGLLVIVGNGTVIAVVASSVSGWSHSSRLVLLSLAAADAALALFVVPLNLYRSLALGTVADEWAMEEEEKEATSYCRVVAFVNSSIFSTSLYSLAGVSLERYIAVFFPLHYSHLLSHRRVALFIATAWLLPVLLLAPMAVPGPSAVFRVRFSAAALLCEPDYASNKAYSLLIAGTIFCPAAGLITFANLRLWMAARSQRRRRKDTANFAGPKKLCSFQLDAAARILLPVVIAFYLCWAPCIFTILYNSFTRKRVNEWVEFVALWLPIGSGFLNCFVYFWVNRSFRRKLQKIRQTLCQPCHEAHPEQWPHCLPTVSAAVEGDGKHKRCPSLFPGCPRIRSSSGSLRCFKQDGSPTNL
ncbi:probable G-protein coupled receptor 21 [Sceloporus undulatus]|uniref:probable G-protein coupled receptor 21 n=1 Tax=Sceloporus undulatus TaxID=8520 RepID=UPI001C4DA700|nr:probable G-protein coupled receptor 21 [Sceloporus undulatus]